MIKIQIIQISNPKDPKCENQIVIDWLEYNQFKYKTNEKHKYDKITIFIYKIELNEWKNKTWTPYVC